jgi:RNA polymerase sigma factor (sigma-70 family)
VARFLLRYQGSTVLLGQGSFVLGRGPEAFLQVDDVEVSRRHAMLHVTAESIHVEDLGSRNGIYLNGERVLGTRTLTHGDVVTLGKQEIRVIEEEERQRRSVLTTVQTPEDAAAIDREVRESDPAPPPSAERAARRDETTGTSSELDKLSKREQEVLRLVALGHTQKEIASELGVSVKTVETYKTRLNEKMGFESRAALVRFAIGAGLLDE